MVYHETATTESKASYRIREKDEREEKEGGGRKPFFKVI